MKTPRIRRPGSGLLGVALFALSGAFSTVAAQEDVQSLALQDIPTSNPYTSAKDVQAGAKLFRSSCALCHGGEGKGDRGPDLTRGQYRHGSSDSALFRNILTGIPGTDMVGIYRGDTEVWQVVAYLRSLSEGAVPVELPGDPARGQRLYQTRGSCPDCHRLAGGGGRLGPDLSDIGWVRSPDYLAASLTDPHSVLHKSYRTVVVKTRQGREYRGVLRNEDTYSVQLLDENENLRSFMKADLESIDKPQESLMPSFESFFSQSDLDNLVAYLSSLREE